MIREASQLIGLTLTSAAIIAIGYTFIWVSWVVFG
jgi:hypothetical protein